ncbi:MAG: peptidyl-alpha-hydroxyglycine alpha-amidating lyase family protein [Bryobacteraceae bacterium]
MSFRSRIVGVVACSCGLWLNPAALAADTPAPHERNAQPSFHQPVEDFFQLPAGRKWGQVPTAHIDAKSHIWAVDRCGSSDCIGKPGVNPIVEFDPSGKLVRQFGAGLFVRPHGIFIDRDGNIWVTDEQAKDNKGYQVIKFTPEGKELMRLGTPGVGGETPATFSHPSDVAIARNGDIFVADGHGSDDSNARIVKFSKDGKFLKTWGRKGTGPSEFNAPHSLAFDSKGRLFVADRGNNRIQIFSQDGKLLDQWKQFGRPTGIYIDAGDTLYVADSDSDAQRNPGWKQGIRIGSAKNGKVREFIPYTGPEPVVGANSTFAEGVTADRFGNVYAADVAGRTLIKYVHK